MRNWTQQDIERNAFVKGYNIVRARKRGRDLASVLMLEISEALKQGGLSLKALHLRKYGYTNHTPTEREKIEQIFRNWGVSEPWGLE